MIHQVTIAGVLIATLGLAAQLAAEPIYTWVDEQGVTHFSQTPPEDRDTGVDTVEITPFASPASTSRFNEMVEMARQLEASRLAREQATLEREFTREQLALQEKWLEQQSAPAPAPAFYAVPALPPKARHPHRDRRHRHDHRFSEEPYIAPNAPFHRSGRHGTPHLRPYKSLH